MASNNATLSAAIGAAVQVSNNRYIANTVAGCATTGSPTGVTFGVDYSQGTSAISSTIVSDYASAISSTTMTSATAAFTPVMVGNIFHLTNAGTGSFGVVGWYEIVSYTNATTVVTDRTTNSGTAMVAGQGRIGGALSLGSSDDAVFELATASATAANRFFVKNGTFTISGAVSIAAAGNAVWPIVAEGYASIRGDRPTGSTRPTFNTGSNGFTWGANWDLYSLQLTGTPSALNTMGASGKAFWSKFINTSTTAGRSATTIGSSGLLFSCEIISYRGNAISTSASTAQVESCYIHDSNVGFTTSSSGIIFINNIISGCVTDGFTSSAALTTGTIISNNTFYGAENKLGTGILFLTGTTNVRAFNNIFYGFTTGVNHPDVNTVGYDNWNNYFNNTNDVNAAANWQKGPSDLALNPSFTNVAQITGTTATTSNTGNTLVDSGKTFQSSGVVAGRDYVYVSSTSGTAGVYGISSVDSETQLTLDLAPGTSSGNVTYQITTGRNFAVGANLKAGGYPGIFPGGFTTGYLDIGAAQRQESSTGGAFTFGG